MKRDYIVGVSGHVDYFHAWGDLRKAFCQLVSIHQGHHDIREQQIDRSCVPLPVVQRLRAVAGFQNAVTRVSHYVAQ